MLMRTIEQCLSQWRQTGSPCSAYAHVPWMKKHQSQIDAATLAGPSERFEMAATGSDAIGGYGYPVGIDHFAKPGGLHGAEALGRHASAQLPRLHH